MASGATQLSEGTTKLAQGIDEYYINMNKFHDEGISKISSLVDDELSSVKELSEIKEELINLSKDYQVYTDKTDEMSGTVKFIMKTKEIKRPESNIAIVETNQVNEEKKGFLGWIKGLYN